MVIIHKPEMLTHAPTHIHTNTVIQKKAHKVYHYFQY